MREQGDGKSRGPHILKCYLFKRASRSLLYTGFPVAFRWPFARLFAFKDGQRRLQDGFWTRLRQVQDGARTAQGAAKTPRRPSDGP